MLRVVPKRIKFRIKVWIYHMFMIEYSHTMLESNDGEAKKERAVKIVLVSNAGLLEKGGNNRYSFNGRGEIIYYNAHILDIIKQKNYQAMANYFDVYLLSDRRRANVLTTNMDELDQIYGVTDDHYVYLTVGD